MDPLTSFRSTIQGADAAVGPINNNLGASPELINFLSSGRGAGLALQGAGALSHQAGTIADNQAAQDEYARRKQISDIKDQISSIQDMQDPSKYKQVLKADGGYDFLDPLGRKINIQAFAQATGKQPSQVLSHSENSLDKQYLEDHKQTQDVVNALVNSDGAYFKKLQKSDPKEFDAIQSVIKASGSNNADAAQNIALQFQKLYPNIYQADQAATGTVGNNLRSSIIQNTGGQVKSPSLLDRLRGVLHLGR